MKWEAKAIKHSGEKRIAIYFEKDATLITRVKKLTGVRWSATLKHGMYQIIQKIDCDLK
jgi:integrase/recombinase XerD